MPIGCLTEIKIILLCSVYGIRASGQTPSKIIDQSLISPPDLLENIRIPIILGNFKKKGCSVVEEPLFFVV